MSPNRTRLPRTHDAVAATLVVLLLPAVAAAADGVVLTLSPGPAADELTLQWAGGSPEYEIFRDSRPQELIDPLNSEATTTGSVLTLPLGSEPLEFFSIAAPPLVDVTGTWETTLGFGGLTRTLVLQLHQRSRGNVLGYILGGTRRRTSVKGLVVGNEIDLELELADPAARRTVTLSGTVTGASFPLQAIVDGAPQLGTLTRRTDVLDERSFGFFALGPEGDPVALTYLAVVQDATDGLVAGAFAADKSCDLWACSGELNAFSETGGVLTLGLESDGCSSGSSASLTFDAVERVYNGTYTFTDCAGTTSGAVIGMRAGTSRSDHVAELLGALGVIADTFESGSPFGEPHPAFAPDYLHYGRSTAGLFAGFNDETATYPRIRARFRPRRAHTVDDPLIHPLAAGPFSLYLDEERAGRPAGGEPEVYRDTIRRPALDLLSVVREEASGWVIAGNQAPAFEFPFDWVPAFDHLTVPTPGGETIFVSVSPYGSHFLPLTGHPQGNLKADHSGLLARDDSQMVEVVGDGDGVREPGELWGFDGGIGGDEIRSRIPVYLAPHDGDVVELFYSESTPVAYFDDVPFWIVELKFPTGLQLQLDHVGAIAEELRVLVLAATGIDTSTYAGPDAELLDGTIIPVTAGTRLAFPQVQARPLPAPYEQYYVGEGSSLVPWAQMEFPLSGLTGAGGHGNLCAFDLMPSSTKTLLQSIMEPDMLDPLSFVYGQGRWARPWTWRAEAVLCPTFADLPDDFSDLDTALGGWLERVSAGTTPDEQFSWIPMQRATTVYDSSLYESPDVDALVLRHKLDGGAFSWALPSGGSVDAYTPAGEVLQRTGHHMLVKWRDLDGGASPPTAPPLYQWAAYRLDVDGLAIKWGSFALTAAAAVQPILGSSEPCDDSVVLCYEHGD